ncbi:MAG TPA: ATP-binding protein [Candidatus Dormibacteraeota bacterium]|nr:ATP-binding protein [Candidatus Dormibacteraeota bacterium]
MTIVAGGPPARAVDVRVADSPLVGIRFHLDLRMGDMQEALIGADRERDAALRRRAWVALELQRNQEARRELLRTLPRQSLLAVRRCLREGVEIAAELARAEEHVRAVERVQSALIQQSRVLREVVSGVGDVVDETEVELSGKASRYSRATRRVQRLVDEQHDAVEHALVEGPLLRLSEAVLDAEVAYKQAQAGPNGAHEKAVACKEATLDARTDFLRLIRHWRPLHGGVTLLEAIQELLADLPSGTGSHILLFGPERALPAATELTAYRVAEDAVDNAVRHGRATHIEIIVAFHPDRLLLVVKDDGDGFDIVATEARLGRSAGSGIVSMQTRAAIAGGRAEVRSVMGGGTEVRAAIPVPAA